MSRDAVSAVFLGLYSIGLFFVGLAMGVALAQFGVI